jgi:predicted RNase H-like HicB family nuclease
MPIAYALIHEEGGVYGISFPDFPGCISTGTNAEEAIRRGSDALTFHVAGMIEDGDPLPMLRDLSELREDPEYRDVAQDAVLAMVSFEVPGKAVRVNISIDENLLDSVDRAAKAVGMSRSAYLAEAARSRIRGAA